MRKLMAAMASPAAFDPKALNGPIGPVSVCFLAKPLANGLHKKADVGVMVREDVVRDNNNPCLTLLNK